MHADFVRINVTNQWAWSPWTSEECALEMLRASFEKNFLAADKTPDRSKVPLPVVIESIPEMMRFPIHALLAIQPPMGIEGLCSMTYGRGPSQIWVIGWKNFEPAMCLYIKWRREESRAHFPDPSQLEREVLRKHQLLVQEQVLRSEKVAAEHLFAVPRDLQMLFGTYDLFISATLTSPDEPLERAPTLHIGFSERRDMMQAGVDFGVMEGTMNLAFSPLVLSEFSRITSSRPEENTSRVPLPQECRPEKRKARCAFNREDHKEEKPTKNMTPEPTSPGMDSNMDIDTTSLASNSGRRVHATFRARCIKTGMVGGHTRSGFLDFNDEFTAFEGHLECPGSNNGHEEVWMLIRGIKIEAFPREMPKMWETYSAAAAQRQARMWAAVRKWRSVKLLSSPDIG
ncbi:hypothetical protein QBC38DRAFT_168980 [Podospora fimiseda]|uniref:Uncharacterized protein n=1 Tax=Podospora fimiseda TaxID=252190 RepID=A0AAN7BEU3_9PEZI|nr:hypothetical protein QBC38DRAFT_168980 [Podospora fimiseda]